MKDLDAMKLGFDRRGNVPCVDCCWSSKSHGDTCPEHGSGSTKIMTIDELYHAYQQLHVENNHGQRRLQEANRRNAQRIELDFAARNAERE